MEQGNTSAVFRRFDWDGIAAIVINRRSTETLNCSGGARLSTRFGSLASRLAKSIDRGTISVEYGGESAACVASARQGMYRS